MHKVNNFEYYSSLVFLFLSGMGMRLTILATPPVIPEITHSLSLDQIQIGILSGLPQVLFATVSIIGAFLIMYWGIFRLLICGMFITAIGSMFRGLADGAITMYLSTFVTGLGVAFMQPAVPAIIKLWFRKKIIYATAIYINGLYIGGELLPVSVTRKYLLPWLGSWRWSFIWWGAIGLLIAVFCLIIIYINKNRLQIFLGKKNTKYWLPDWKNGLFWQLGIIMGCMNSVYFVSNFFMSKYLITEFGYMLPHALFWLNIGQIPGAILLLFVLDSWFAIKRLPYILSGLGLSFSLLMIVLFHYIYVIYTCLFIIGFCVAIIFILVQSIPSLISDEHKLSSNISLIFTVSYGISTIVSIVTGYLIDMNDNSFYTLFSMAFCILLCLILSWKVFTGLEKINQQ